MLDVHSNFFKVLRRILNNISDEKQSKSYHVGLRKVYYPPLTPDSQNHLIHVAFRSIMSHFEWKHQYLRRSRGNLGWRRARKKSFFDTKTYLIKKENNSPQTTYIVFHLKNSNRDARKNVLSFCVLQVPFSRSCRFYRRDFWKSLTLGMKTERW